MSKKPFEPDTLEVACEIANASIGFCLLSTVGNTENAFPSGSGTLVRYGRIAGVITAGHVLKEGRVAKASLPDKGNVGLVRFPRQKNKTQNYKLEMAYTSKLAIWSGEESDRGPDIGFLRLPLPVVAQLEATNTFLNLEKRYNDVTAEEQPGPPWFEAVVGSVGEWVKDLSPVRAGTRLKGFELLFGAGKASEKKKRDGFDTCHFDVSYSNLVKPPKSYGGVSGGGMWRVYYEEGANGQTVIRERRFVGVAFFEKRLASKLQIVCHGPASVYSRLRERIATEWPNDI